MQRSILLTAIAFSSGDALAGLAPSDVIVVVNSGSTNSRTLANHYVALRGIPAANVVVLDGVPNTEVTTVDDFRSKILRPLLAEIERRGLAPHIQCIAYSADFPTAIDISKDLEPLKQLPQTFSHKTASINSLTYLYRLVLLADPNYITPEINAFARRPTNAYFTNPIGSLTAVAWRGIQDRIAAGEHDKASEELEDLHKKFPEQFPLAYLAGAQAALADQTDRAIELLNRAIAAGWNDGDYMAADSQLDSLRENADFQLLEYLVTENKTGMQPPIGFNAATTWMPNGVVTKKPQWGYRYLLSTVLGVTRGSGTSLQQAIDAITRSAAADFSHPEGSFFFALTSDIRTKTREPGFSSAIASLKELGFSAEVIRTALPQNAANVLGVQIGTPKFDWNSSGSELVPGAIADNLTSHGGIMSRIGGQTKLSEFIKAGAAGSSGTVAEPYALQAKFPHPMMYAYYAQGASLAEAFYLSITGPYQLLIVGDPLCRPFAHASPPPLDRKLRTAETGDRLEFSFDTSLPTFAQWSQSDTPQAKRTDRIAPAAIAVLINRAQPGKKQRSIVASRIQPTVGLRLSKLPPGHHDVTLRFYADDPLKQRSDVNISIWLGEKGVVDLELPAIEAEPNTAQSTGLLAIEEAYSLSFQDESFRISASIPQANSVSIWHESEQIALSPSSSGEFSIKLSEIGMGPVRLHARGELEDGTFVFSTPILLNVGP